MLWNSLSGVLLLCPIGFGLYIHFHLFTNNFLISSLISLLTHWLFNNMLFSFHVFECFLVFYWGWFLVSSHYNPRKCIWFHFSWTCSDLFLSYHVVYLWEWSICTLEECVFFCFGMTCSININWTHSLFKVTVSLLNFSLVTVGC